MADEIQVQVMYVISEQQLREPVSDSLLPPLSSCFFSLGTNASQGLYISASFPTVGGQLKLTGPAAGVIGMVTWGRVPEGPLRGTVVTYLLFGREPESRRSAHIWWVPAMAIHRMSFLWTSEPSKKKKNKLHVFFIYIYIYLVSMTLLRNGNSMADTNF